MTPLGMAVDTFADDQELLRRIRQHDEQAFEVLYHRYVRLLLNAAFQRLQDKDLTEEVVQDLFVSVWIKRSQLFVTGSLQAYLHKALRNKVIDYHRQQHRRAELNDVSEQDLITNVSEEQLFYQDLLTAYELRLAQLPDKCRTVFNLYKQGVSVPEIAKQLGMAPKTVESHLLKANRTLRTQLRDYTLLLILMAVVA